VSDAAELFASAVDALSRGDVAGGAALLHDCLEREDLPDARDALGAVCYMDDDLDGARRQWEHAFRGFRDADGLCAAARVATRLGQLHWGALGNEATGRGWLERARRLLDQVGPCVEWGYWELAQLACDRPDVDALASSAERAIDVATRYGDHDLEVRALGDLGVALVSQGRVREGFERLDEALAALTAGDVRDPYVIGTTFCALLTSCDRTGDVERATEWIRVVRELVLDLTGGRPRVLATHCQVAFGGVLSAAGRWPEAEEAILAALGPEASPSVAHRTEATARLAELRLQQGRVDEAAALLAPVEDRLAAAGPLATLHLRRGEPALAVAVLENAVRQLVGDSLRAAPLLCTLVEADLACGDAGAAADAAKLLRSMSVAVDAPVVGALAHVADGRVARAAGRTTDALESFDAALARLGDDDRPALAAEIHLERAESLDDAGDRGAAIASARAAHAAAQRIGAAQLSDRTAALLRRLGVRPPRARVPASASAPSSSALDALTARERDVLDGVRAGDSNAQIATRLFLSPKTVEHHVSRILAKLGVRTRAEAAAVAAAADSVATP
jgi:ATP/maltotriose-dependent transcriptional regulator MalT